MEKPKPPHKLKITDYFEKVSAAEQAKQVIAISEARTDLNIDEREKLATDASAEIRKNSRTNKKLSNYTDDFISDVVSIALKEGNKEARAHARVEGIVSFCRTTLLKLGRKRPSI